MDFSNVCPNGTHYLMELESFTYISKTLQFNQLMCVLRIHSR